MLSKILDDFITLKIEVEIFRCLFMKILKMSLIFLQFVGFILEEKKITHQFLV